MISGYNSSEDDAVWDLHYYIRYNRPRGTPNLPSATGPPASDHGTVPRPPHTAALGVPGERTGAAVQLGERGAWKGALPAMVCSVLGKAGGSRDREGFQYFWRRVFPED